MPEHVHRHGCCAPLRSSERQFVGQPAKVGPECGVTVRARGTGADMHARECADKGAAHAEVPQRGDGLEGKCRSVDVVICISQVCSAAHTCTARHITCRVRQATRPPQHITPRVSFESTSSRTCTRVTRTAHAATGNALAPSQSHLIITSPTLCSAHVVAVIAAQKNCLGTYDRHDDLRTQSHIRPAR